MKKIAVTGANGMTGSHMISLLKSKKIPVKPITRKEWDLTKWIIKNKDVAWVFWAPGQASAPYGIV